MNDILDPMIDSEKLQDANLSALSKLWFTACHHFQLSKSEASELMTGYLDKNYPSPVERKKKGSNFPRALWNQNSMTWATMMSGLELLTLDSARLHITLTSPEGHQIYQTYELDPAKEPRSPDKAIAKPSVPNRSMVINSKETKLECNNYLAYIIRDLMDKQNVTWLKYDYLIKDYSLNTDIQKARRLDSSKLKTQSKSYLLKSELSFDNFIAALEVLGFPTITIKLTIQRGERTAYSMLEFS